LRDVPAAAVWAAGACALVALAACGCGKPFLGVPEWQSRKVGDEHPTSALADVVTMTPVKKVTYRDYLVAMRQGRIVAEERRAGTVWFAVTSQYCVPAAGADPGAGGAMVIVTERYKAPLPEAPPPPAPKLDRPMSPTPQGVRPRDVKTPKPAKPPELPEAYKPPKK
jgi:hypothetical protein